MRSDENRYAAETEHSHKRDRLRGNGQGEYENGGHGTKKNIYSRVCDGVVAGRTARDRCAGATAENHRDRESSGQAEGCFGQAKAGGDAGGGPDARRLRGQVSWAMVRRVEKAGGRRRVVPRRGLSLCGDRNMRRPRDDFNRSISRHPRNDRERLVGAGNAKDGDVYFGPEGEKCRVRGSERERRR